MDGHAPGADEAAARLIERVLSDSAFRAQYRRDPEAAARQAGLEPVDGRAFETLELRESKSSLAGAFMAAAMEGLALYEVVDHGGLGAGTAEAAVHQAPSATLEVLQNPRIELDATGVADLRAGRIDPRIVAILDEVANHHRITVSALMSDHDVRTAGGSISNHHYGRAVDIAMVDGRRVEPGNDAARELAAALLRLDPGVRPTELGSPWALDDPAAFTDGDHQDHIHVAFDDPMAPGRPAPGPVLEEPDAPDTPDEDAESDDSDTSDEPDGPDEDEENDADDDAGDSDDAGDEDEPDEDEDEDEDEPDEEEPDEVGPDAGSHARAALAEARKYLGTPYRWGGSSPRTGFDCSGFVQWAYAEAGIRIPRVTDQQILAEGATKVDRRHLLPGDLVFFRDATGYVHHVGMSLGGDRFIHAPHTGDVVKVSSLKESYYAEQFTGGRRFDPAAAQPEASAADEHDVTRARAALERDAAEVDRPGTALFLAIEAQERDKNSHTQVLAAIRPDQVRTR